MCHAYHLFNRVSFAGLIFLFSILFRNQRMVRTTRGNERKTLTVDFVSMRHVRSAATVLWLCVDYRLGELHQPGFYFPLVSSHNFVFKRRKETKFQLITFFFYIPRMAMNKLIFNSSKKRKTRPKAIWRDWRSGIFQLGKAKWRLWPLIDRYLGRHPSVDSFRAATFQWFNPNGHH